jgi:hypothetical protein
MLLLNGIRNESGPCDWVGYHPQHYFADGKLPSQVFGFGKRAAIPRGYYHPQAICMPITAGEMSAAQYRVEGTGTISASMLAVLLAVASLTGDGTISDAFGSLIVQAIASISGSGTISDADLKAFLDAVANLTGSGDIAGTATGLGELLAGLTGTGNATGTFTGIGELSANLGGTGDVLTNASIAAAVWSAAVRTLTSGGGGGGATAEEVWDYLLSDADDVDGSVGQQLARLLTVAKFLGLK